MFYTELLSNYRGSATNLSLYIMGSRNSLLQLKVNREIFLQEPWLMNLCKKPYKVICARTPWTVRVLLELYCHETLGLLSNTLTVKNAIKTKVFFLCFILCINKKNNIKNNNNSNNNKNILIMIMIMVIIIKIIIVIITIIIILIIIIIIINN